MGGDVDGVSVGIEESSRVGLLVGDAVVGADESSRIGLPVGDAVVGANESSCVGGGVVGSVVGVEEGRSEGAPVGSRLAVVAKTLGVTVGFKVASRLVAMLVATVVGNDEGAMLGTDAFGLNNGRNDGVVVNAGILEGVNVVSTAESRFGVDVPWIGAAGGASDVTGASTTSIVNVGDELGVNVVAVAGVVCVGDIVVAILGYVVGACGPITDIEIEGASVSVLVSSSIVSNVSTPSFVETAAAEVSCSSFERDWL